MIENMPLNANGKINRVELKKRYIGGTDNDDKRNNLRN